MVFITFIIIIIIIMIIAMQDDATSDLKYVVVRPTRAVIIGWRGTYQVVSYHIISYHIIYIYIHMHKCIHAYMYICLDT